MSNPAQRILTGLQRLRKAIINAELGGVEKSVLHTLAHYADREKYNCWPTIQTIAEKSGWRKTAALKAIASLEDKGVLHCKRKHRQPTVYTILIEELERPGLGPPNAPNLGPSDTPKATFGSVSRTSRVRLADALGPPGGPHLSNDPSNEPHQHHQHHERREVNSRSGGGAAAGGGVRALTERQEKCYRLIAERPAWIAQDGSWVDAITARQLALLPTTTEELIAMSLKEARGKRKTLTNPAGLVVRRLKSPDPELVAAIAKRAAESDAFSYTRGEPDTRDGGEPDPTPISLTKREEVP